jgi:hypothetical protein
MKIKNTFPTFVLELCFTTIANCKKLKIQKIQKSTSPTVQGVGEKWIFSSSSRSFGYDYESVRIRANLLISQVC